MLVVKNSESTRPPNLIDLSRATSRQITVIIPLTKNSIRPRFLPGRGGVFLGFWIVRGSILEHGTRFNNVKLQ